MIGLGISVSLNQRQDAEQAQDLNKWHNVPYKPLPTGSRRPSVRSPLQTLAIQIRNKMVPSKVRSCTLEYLFYGLCFSPQH